MDIEAVTDTAVALRFERGELRGEMSGEEAKRLVSGILTMRGMEAWGSIEVDLFSLSGSLLLLARPSHRLLIYEFTDFETLLGACFAAGEAPDSRLTYCEGCWYLCVPGDGPICLREYGELLEDSGLFAAHLLEHGRELLAGDAVAALASMFGKGP